MKDAAGGTKPFVMSFPTPQANIRCPQLVSRLKKIERSFFCFLFADSIATLTSSIPSHDSCSSSMKTLFPSEKTTRIERQNRERGNYSQARCSMLSISLIYYLEFIL